MPQVRVSDEVFDYFKDKAQKEDRSIGVQINRELKAVIAKDLDEAKKDVR